MVEHRRCLMNIFYRTKYKICSETVYRYLFLIDVITMDVADTSMCQVCSQEVRFQFICIKTKSYRVTRL